MTKTKRPIKQLPLTTHTLRPLTPEQLAGVAGGDTLRFGKTSYLC